jgi:tetrahydromethanopterin S-methyltransferase subunit C
VSGIVLGIVFVFLGQQLSYFDLSDLVTSVEYLVIAMVIGAVIFGVIGWALGRAYLHRHPEEAGPPPSNP